MATHDSVDAYLDALPAEARRILRRVRTVITRSVPGLEESVSYKIPTYKLGGKPVVFFAAWKSHWSLYPATTSVFAEVPELLPFKHAKDTVRFDYAERLPVHLVARMAKVRAGEAMGSAPGARTKTKSTSKVKPKKTGSTTTKPTTKATRAPRKAAKRSPGK